MYTLIIGQDEQRVNQIDLVEGGIMKSNNKLIISFAMAFVMSGFAAISAAEELLSLNQELRLYPAPKQYDSYSLYYDITLDSPGLIRIGLEVDETFPDKEGSSKFLSISLKQRDEEKEMRFIEFDQAGGMLTYSVDAYELDQTKGEYRIVVSNWSLQHTVSAKLVALYPTIGEAETGKKIILLPGSRI